MLVYAGNNKLAINTYHFWVRKRQIFISILYTAAEHRENASHSEFMSASTQGSIDNNNDHGVRTTNNGNNSNNNNNNNKAISETMQKYRQTRADSPLHDATLMRIFVALAGQYIFKCAGVFVG